MNAVLPRNCNELKAIKLNLEGDECLIRNCKHGDSHIKQTNKIEKKSKIKKDLTSERTESGLKDTVTVI